MHSWGILKDWMPGLGLGAAQGDEGQRAQKKKGRPEGRPFFSTSGDGL